MDFPKSVPGVGLVDGQFVDEDQVTGTPGSLIPAAWGNAVTQELLNVIRAAGLEPSEADNAQLLVAIKTFSLGGVQVLSESAVLSAAARGLVLLNAASAPVTVTLPATAEVGTVELTLRRTDVAEHAASIAASGADKVMLDTTFETAGQTTTELLFAGDYLRLRSDGAGKWWCVGQAHLPGGIASGLEVFSTAGLHTFNTPAVLRSGRRLAKVTVEGAGGGAGGHKSGGGGGGGGGVGVSLISLVGVSSVQISVGAGGAGCAAGASPASGADGESSSFGSYVSATGGKGGDSWLGGASGFGVGAAVISGHGPGNSGSQHNNNTPPQASAAGGHGGGPLGGGPSGSATVPTKGNDGGTASGGGGGNANGTSFGAGGSGGAGRVRVEW